MKLTERNFPKIELNEDQAGTMMMKFKVLALDGLPTGNNRVYSTPIVQKAVKKLQQKIERVGPAYGSSGHKKGGPELDDVSHIITKAEIKDGAVWVEAKVLPTQKGRNLQAILKGGGKLGVSIRGAGSTRTNEKGQEEVTEDYELLGADFCLDPSTQNFVSQKENVFESATILTPVDEELLDERFRQACVAGFRGTKEQYRKIFVERKQAALNAITESGPEDEPDPPAADDPEVPHEICEHVRQVLGENYSIMDVDEKEKIIYLFSSRTSEMGAIAYHESINGNAGIALEGDIDIFDV